MFTHFKPAYLRAIILRSVSAAALSLPGHAALAQTPSSDEIAALRRELHAQQQITRQLERRIDALAKAQKSNAAATQLQIRNVGEQARLVSHQDTMAQIAAMPQPQPARDIVGGYKDGFYVSDASGDDSLYINGLLQPRFRYFAPSGTAKFGAKDQASNNFDDFLARLYFSGHVIDPSLTYWFTLQASTQNAVGAPGIILLDGEIAKLFNPYLKVEMGRYWSAYTFEYYLDIGQYLLPDLSAAEWAFALGRQVGVRASGQVGRISYSLSLSNPIPGSQSGTTENTTTKLAVIGHLNWDILAPYAPMETDPDPHGVSTPQLSLWGSVAYNPVQTGSRIYNDVKGDNTDGATVSLNFRDGFFSFQGSGYYKHNDARGAEDGLPAHGAFDSYGWQEQAGYYVVPGRFELVERVDGIHWGYQQTGPTVADSASDTQWYAGPDNFGYQDMTEYSAGFNYYLHGHKAKVQVAYSYLAGSTFSHQDFSANRLIAQAQLAF